MKVLVVHNQYREPGGEDQVVIAEAAMLESAGHQVIRYSVHNEDVDDNARLTLARNTIWSTAAYRDLRLICRQERPDVVHFHNTLPLVSPSGYYAAKHEGIPVVQTLHNYRLLCPNGMFLRAGRVCEDCLGNAIPFPAIRHACYRSSRAATATVAAMLATHRGLGTWDSQVDTYIALTEFARSKFVEGGLPQDRVRLKPNFIPTDPGIGTHETRSAVFVGRLSPEKGVKTLLEAWRLLRPSVQLSIAGGGPLEFLAASSPPGVQWLGRQNRAEIFSLLRRSAFLVMPSEWYETFGLTIIEAFATGLPVVASRIGAVAELVEEGVTGLHFTPGDAKDLASKVEWAVSHPAEMARMGSTARQVYETRYTPEPNYRMLLDIYQAVAAKGHHRGPCNPLEVLPPPAVSEEVSSESRKGSDGEGGRLRTGHVGPTPKME